MVWQRSLRSSYFLAGLGAIAVLGVGAALYFSRSQPLDTAAMLAYLPERDSSLFYADVSAIRKSGVLDKLVGPAIGEEAEYKSFVAQTGFDYKRDLDRVVGSTGDGVSYFLLEGRFDWPKLRDSVKQQGGACSGDDCHVKGSTPERIISFRKLKQNLMALASGPSDTASRAIERRPARALPFDMPAQPVWVSLPASAIRSQQNVPPGTKLFQKALETADRVLLTVGANGTDFELAMDVTCSREEDAVILKHQLDGLTQLLQSFLAREKKSPSQTDLSAVLTSGVFDRAGQHVKARWKLPRAFLDSLGKS